MQEQALDMLLVTSLHSIYYLFGIDRVASAGVFQGVLLSLDRPPVAVVWTYWDILFAQSPLIGEIRTWVRDYDEAAEVLAQTFSEFPKATRVGVEISDSAVPPRTHMRVVEKLRAQGAQIVDASDLVTRLRVVKSPTEVLCMRRAAELLDIHFEAAFAAMKPGARESDAAGAAINATYSAGGEHCIFPPLMTTGINTLHRTIHSPSRRRFKPGELIVLEAGAAFQRYHVVGAHTVVCGAKPTTEQRGHYAMARARIDLALSLIGPGVPIAKIAKAMAEQFGATDVEGNLDVEGNMAYTTGIGCGDIWYEGWTIKETDEWILEPGTVISLFGASEKPDEYLVLCTDPVLITDSGHEPLTKLKRADLRVVGT
jgi:Xaa-Pro dipeptidase